MPIIYPEGGMPGLLLKQKQEIKPGAIDTFKVQLIPIRTAPTAKITGPEDVAGLVREMEDYDRESSKIIHLNTKNYVMGIETISIGSLSASIVHPRETVKGAILNNSANVIFVHNHPSGVCEPSQEDLNISEKLREAFETVGITLLDSIIVGKGCHYSLRENGFITTKTERLPLSGSVREPSQEIKDKVEFITAMTEYIKAPDLERRKRASDSIQASKYFKPWANEFFYEHDLQRAKQNLMKFFAANEQGLGFINYTYYGVIQEYLRAIFKPVAGLMVRERAGAEVEIKHEPRKIFPWRVVYAGTDKTVQTREYPEAMAYYTEREAERGIAEEGLTLVKKGRTPTTVFQRLFPPITPQILKEYEDLYKIYGKKWAEDYRRDRGADWEVLNLSSKSPTIAEDYKAEFVEYARYGFEVYGEYKLENGMHNYYLYMKKGRTPITVSGNIAEGARQIWLEDAIYEYVKNNPRVDSVDIALHFKLRADITLNALAQLVKDHKVERKWLGFRYGYIPLTEQKSPSTVSENMQSTQVDKFTVLKTEMHGTQYLTYVQTSGGQKYSEWGATQEESVKNAMDKAKRLHELGKTLHPERYTVSENITNNREFRKSFEKTWDSKTAGVPAGLKEDIYLITHTVDTSRALPIPESLITGAAIPEKGFLYAYHVTDNPEGVMQKFKSNIPLCQLNPAGDLGCGLYVSGVPEYWRVRSTMKWEFAKNLTRAQRQSLVNVILSDPNYKKGGGYLADFEVDYLNRDLKQFIETGDMNLLAGTGSQPYNVHITKEIARKAGVPEPKEPRFIKVKLQGKFINAAGLYSNQEIVNRAKAWAVINRPKLLEWNKRVSTQNVVNAWLCSMGYCGAFTKSGFSTNPEMVIWGRKAIIDAWIPE